MKTYFQIVAVFTGLATMIALMLAFIDPSRVWLALSCSMVFVVSFIASTMGE